MEQIIKPPLLSTGFSQSKTSMKKRLANILHPGAKRSGLLFFVLALSLMAVLGVIIACGVQAKVVPFDHTRLQEMMGQKKEQVFSFLQLDESSAMITRRDRQEQYSFATKLADNSSSVDLFIYNDVMISYQYNFADKEAAYEYARKIRQNLATLYGEPASYPIESATQASFDSLKSAADLKVTELGMIYYEDWASVKDPGLEKELLGPAEAARIDLRMQLTCLPNHEAQLLVRYLAIRESLE